MLCVWPAWFRWQKGHGNSSLLSEYEEEPHDLLGPVHQQLVMHCLDELMLCEPNLSQFQSKLEDQLSQWLLFECKFTKKPPQLTRERELSDWVLQSWVLDLLSSVVIPEYYVPILHPVKYPNPHTVVTSHILYFMDYSLAIIGEWWTESPSL